jgi:hypothetical protein
MKQDIIVLFLPETKTPGLITVVYLELVTLDWSTGGGKLKHILIIVQCPNYTLTVDPLKSVKLS